MSNEWLTQFKTYFRTTWEFLRENPDALLLGALALLYLSLWLVVLRQASGGRARTVPDVSVDDIFSWSCNPTLAMRTLRVTYGWRVQQWMLGAKACLGALVLYAGLVVWGAVGGQLDILDSDYRWLVGLGIALPAFAFIMCQRRINRIRSEFDRLSSLITMLG